MIVTPWTEGNVIAAIARDFKWWVHLMVPNVCEGCEMDLAVLTKANILWEVEIKVSKSDWKKDLAKCKRYAEGWNPQRFYYAVPESLVPDKKIPEWVPDWAGVICLSQRARDNKIIVSSHLRQSKLLHRNKANEKIRIALLNKLAFRYWTHVSGVEATKPLEIVP